MTSATHVGNTRLVTFDKTKLSDLSSRVCALIAEKHGSVGRCCAMFDGMILSSSETFRVLVPFVLTTSDV